MLDENKNILDFTGVSKFHEAGYYGKRVVAATGESLITEKAIEQGYKVILPEPLYLSGDREHGLVTALTFWQVAPEATLVSVPYQNCYINGKSYDFPTTTLEILKSYGVTSMFLSVLNTDNDKARLDEALENYPEFFYAVSAGNDNTNSYNQLTNCKYTYGIGAYYLYQDTIPTAEDYSSESNSVDFSAPARVFSQAYSFNPPYPFGGTSCSTPFFCGMVALVNDFFIDKTGKPLSREMMYQFLKDHSYDFYEDGKDTKTGYGYVVLPDPNTIDIGRYAPLEITMQIGSNKMTVNGETKVLDQAPIIAPTGRTLAPVRAVFEAAGLTVSWDALTKTITATR